MFMLFYVHLRIQLAKLITYLNDGASAVSSRNFIILVLSLVSLNIIKCIVIDCFFCTHAENRSLDSTQVPNWVLFHVFLSNCTQIYVKFEYDEYLYCCFQPTLLSKPAGSWFLPPVTVIPLDPLRHIGSNV